MKPELVVVGGGIGGAAAVLRAAQYELPTVWILGSARTRKASRAAYVRNIDNMLGIHPDIVRKLLLAEVEAAHPEAARLLRETHLHIGTEALVDNVKERIEADFAEWVISVPEAATAARVSEGTFEIETESGTTHQAPAVILAQGVSDRQPTVHKERGDRTLPGIHWIFPYANHETFLYCIRCEGHLSRGRPVGVIGAGNGAAEVALKLRERYDVAVTVLTAGDEPSWSEERGRLLELESVRVLPGRLVDVIGADRGATLRGLTVEGGETAEVELAFVSMGLHRVHNDLARQLGADLQPGDEPEDRRHVRVSHQAETTVSGLFVVGDMAWREDEPMMKQVYTAQEYAVRAVDSIDSRRRRAHRARLLNSPGG